jgi:hypothetical protein
MATVFWCDTTSKLSQPDTWRTRGGHMANIAKYLYIPTFTLKEGVMKWKEEKLPYKGITESEAQNGL